MSAATVSIYEQAARRLKAEKLAFHLHQSGIKAADIPQISSNIWVMLAKAVGVHAPSEATITAVADILRDIEAAEARVTPQTDPFARFA